jgi:hypothetical protein
MSRLPPVGALALCGVVALAWAATLVAADFSAERATKASARGDYAAAVRYIDRAVSLNPLMKSYLEQKVQAHRNAAPPVAGRGEGLQHSIDISETLLDRFEPGAVDLIDLGLTQLELAQLQGDPPNNAYATMEEGIKLDPYNVLLQHFMADFYRQQNRDDLALLHDIVVYCWTQPCEN